MNKAYLLFLVLLFSFNAKLLSQNSEFDLQSAEVALNYSKTIVIYSEAVQDSFYIFIKTPKGYDKNPDKKYPTIILLDGDIAFPMAWSVVRYLQYGNYVPDVFIVGIGYGGLLSSKTINHRERDYSISRLDSIKDSGGGEKFLEFIKKELIPFLNTKYRIDSAKLTLSGHSLGGLFVLYTLFAEPELFSSYISSSPYTLYDIKYLLSLEEQNKNRIKKLNRRLFISVGANENKKEFIEPINKIVDKLVDSDSSSTKINFRVFENGAHFTTPAEALIYGLIFSYEH
jgi:predicted alpha/beta superfamily hydrolase